MKHFFSKDGVTKRTDYIDTIDRFSSRFGEENVLIGFYDAIIAQPNQLLSDIVRFVGGEPVISNQKKQLEKIVNESPKSDIPEEIEQFLNNKYAPMIEELSRRYGSYATRWLDDLQGVENRNVEFKATVGADI